MVMAKKTFFNCKKNNLIPFSSPFHFEAVDFLEKINCPIYKVASLENTFFPLIKKIIKTKKPIIVSTGASTFDEIKEIISFLKKNKCKNYAILKCTSSYPSNLNDLNLKTIPELKKKFKCIVGFSDHTKGLDSAIVAVSLGAKIIEKHVKLNNSDKTVDSKFSITPVELKKYINKLKNAVDAMGSENIYLTESEKFARTRKRSIYLREDLEINQKLNKNNICIIRPGHGLPSKYYDEVIGKRIVKKLIKGTPLKWSLLK